MDGFGDDASGASLGEIYEAFASEYGFTREYIQGEWKDGRLRGFTRPLLYYYWINLQKRKVEELKTQAAFAGIDISGKEEKERKAQQAREKLTDPLSNFPEDVEYFDEKGCKGKERISVRARNRLPLEQQWPKYRTECCLGKYGRAARRCSMNHVLWGRYLESVQQGHPLPLGVVKAMVEFDFVRKKLYPPDYRGAGTEPPPAEYLAQLQKSGVYSDIMRQLTGITRRIQNGCQS